MLYISDWLASSLAVLSDDDAECRGALRGGGVGSSSGCGRGYKVYVIVSENQENGALFKITFRSKGGFMLASVRIGRRRRTKVDIVSTRATMSVDFGRCPTTLV